MANDGWVDGLVIVRPEHIQLMRRAISGGGRAPTSAIRVNLGSI